MSKICVTVVVDLFLRKKQGKKANRFVLGAPSQRLQSGGSQTEPPVCGECLTVAFACPIKLSSGAIVVQLVPHDQTDQAFSIKKLSENVNPWRIEPDCRTVSAN